MSTRRAGCRTVLILVAAAGVPALAAGCSSSSTPTNGSTLTATQSTSTGASPHAAATSVTVDEKEYSLTLSRSAFMPGTYTFVASDVGHLTHALAVDGPGVATTRTGPINPGGSADLTVTLQPGSYELWCPIDDHKALGMDTHITVSAPSAGVSTSPAHMVQ